MPGKKRAAPRTLEPNLDLELMSPSDPCFSSSQRDDDAAPRRVRKRTKEPAAPKGSLLANIDESDNHAAVQDACQSPFGESKTPVKGTGAAHVIPQAEDASAMSIGLTGFDEDEKLMLQGIVKSLASRSDRRVALMSEPDPGTKLTHLVVESGRSRTLRVIFALLHQCHIVRKDFLTSALDGRWGSACSFSVEGRDWGPNPLRQRVLEGEHVCIDREVTNPPLAALARIVELAGGKLARRPQGASLMIKASDSSEAASHSGLRKLTVASLFDLIECPKLDK